MTPRSPSMPAPHGPARTLVVGAAPRGVSLVELLVCLGIIGVMVSMLMPAIHAARMASQRTVCVNHKSQIALAMQMYADAHSGDFPPPRGETPSGWTWEILPFMEEGALHASFDRKQPWNSAANAAAAKARPPLYRCAFAPSWRASLVKGVVPSDFVLVVQEGPRGNRNKRKFSWRVVHAPESTEVALPWSVGVEVTEEEYFRRRAADDWKPWHPPSSGTGLSGLIDGDGAE